MANYDNYGRLKIALSGSGGGGGGPSPVIRSYPIIEGFQTSDLADVYRSNANGVMTGADDFVAVGLCFPFDNRNSGGYQLLVNNFYQSGPDIYGWGIFWSYGTVAVAYIRDDGATGTLEMSTAAQTVWNDVQRKGTLHSIGLRLTGAGPASAGVLELWLGGAKFITTTATGNGSLRINSAGPMNLGGGGLYFQELAMNGGVCGLGYYVGTVSEDDMRSIMVDTLQTGSIPESTIAWDVVIRGTTMSPIPSSFTTDVGSVLFDRVGSPTALVLGGRIL